MAAINITDLKTVVECAICLDTLDDPKTLHCHHTYCKRCVDGLLEFQQNGSATIKCPKMCDKNTLITSNQTTNDLGVDYALKDLLNLISKAEQSSSNEGQCDFCSEDSVKYCLFCATFLCSTCADPHDEITNAFKHVKYNKKVDQFRFSCVEHKTDVDFICCGDTNVCVYCRHRPPHRNHNPKTLDEVERSMKEELKKDIEAKKNISQRLKEIREQIGKAKSELERILSRKILNSLAEYATFLTEEAESIRANFHNVTNEHVENIKSLDHNEFLKYCLSETGFNFLLHRDQAKKFMNLQSTISKISISLTEESFQDDHPLGVLHCEKGLPMFPVNNNTFESKLSLAKVTSLSVDYVKEIISNSSEELHMENKPLDEKEWGEQCLGSGSINYKVEQVSKISTLIESGSLLYVRGIWWGIGLEPVVADGQKYARIYLTRKSLQPKMGSKFKFILKNYKGADFVKGGFCDFKVGVNKVKVDRYILWSDLENANNGYLRNDSISITLLIEVGVPRDKIPWDSKRFTKFIGIQRQKHSCCHNNVLQSLFSLTKLRKVLLVIDESNIKSEEKEVALLQCFRDLNNNTDSASANKLHRLLGCIESQYTKFHLYEVLYEVLFESMKMLLKVSATPGIISELFEGKKLSKLVCENSAHNNCKEELYCGIKLTMKDCTSLEESLNDYMKCNELTSPACNENCAIIKREVVFQSCPSVLQFHIIARKSLYKEFSSFILDKYFIPIQLDMSKYFSKDARDEVVAHYSLHSVLCQSCVYITPKGDGNWLKFEDTVVSQVTVEEACQINFLSSIHMLTYIRTSEIQDILL